MSRFAIGTALALLAGALLLWLLRYDSGYVLIVIWGKTIEMKFWFAVFAVLTLGFVIAVIYRKLRQLVLAVSSGWSFAKAARYKKSELRVQRGLLSYCEGDWLTAQKLLVRAAKDAKEPLALYLTAARSAQLLNRHDEAVELLKKAESCATEGDLDVALASAHVMFLDGQYGDALKILHKLQTAHADSPVVLKLMTKSYLAVNDWVALEALLPLLKRHKIMQSNEYDKLVRQVYMQLLERVQHLGDGWGRQECLQELEGIWKRAPRTVISSTSFVASYCVMLIELQCCDQAEALLRTTLKNQWDTVLVDLYGRCQSKDGSSQMKYAQQWLKEHSDDDRLLLALGRIAARLEIWGQAKAFLQQSLELKACSEVYAELGLLLLQLNEDEASRRCFQDGLLLAVSDRPLLSGP